MKSIVHQKSPDPGSRCSVYKEPNNHSTEQTTDTTEHVVTDDSPGPKTRELNYAQMHDWAHVQKHGSGSNCNGCGPASTCPRRLFSPQQVSARVAGTSWQISTRQRRRVIYMRHAIKNGEKRRQTQGGAVAESPVVTEGSFLGSIVHYLQMSANKECCPSQQMSTKMKKSFLFENVRACFIYLLILNSNEGASHN